MYKPAKEPNELEKYFVERVNAGDLEGLLVLYEETAIIADGKGKIVSGKDEIREFFMIFLKKHHQLQPSDQSPALITSDIALTSSRLSNGHITAEVARRQPDGNWLWVVDQFSL